MRSTLSVPLRGLLPLAALLVVWQLIGQERSATFPRPSSWWTALGSLQDSGVLGPALRETIVTFAIALVVAAVTGTVLGAVLGASRRADRALGPLLEIFRTLPPPAIVPAAVLLLGSNRKMSVIVIVFAAVWPILLNVATAMRSVPPVRLEMARTLGLSRLDQLRKVVLPSLTPGVALGLRVAAPICLIVTLLVEIIASTGGAGTLLSVRQQSFDAPAVFALLFVIGVLGFIVNAGISAGERRALRHWPEGGGA